MVRLFDLVVFFGRIAPKFNPREVPGRSWERFGTKEGAMNGIWLFFVP